MVLFKNKMGVYILRLNNLAEFFEVQNKAEAEAMIRNAVKSSDFVGVWFVSMLQFPYGGPSCVLPDVESVCRMQVSAAPEGGLSCIRSRPDSASGGTLAGPLERVDEDGENVRP